MEKMTCFGEDDRMYNGFIVEDSMKLHEISEGSESKFLILVGDTKYLVKDSSINQKRKQPSLAPFCEYVGSNFIRNSGLLKCQETYLGKYCGRDVVICKDLFPDCEFQPFKDLHQSSAGTDLESKLYTYADVLHVLQRKADLGTSQLQDFKRSFWLMFLFDAILGNRDRHEGNWGFVKKGGTVRLAPIFDNGSSLFPDVNLEIWNSKEFIEERVYHIPGSQLKMWKPGITDRPMRTNYYEILTNYSDEFHQELVDVQALDFNHIMIQSLKDVPQFCYNWFKTISKFRFECLILNRNFDDVWKEYQNDWNNYI